MKAKRIETKPDLMRVTLDESVQPQITILYYPYYIYRVDKDKTNIPEDSEYLVNLSMKDIRIDVYEASSRPLSDFPQIVDIIVYFVSIKLLEGFFNAIGVTLWEKLVKKFTEIAPIRKDSLNRDIKTGLHISYPLILENNQVKIIVAVRIDELPLLGKEPYSLNSISNYVKDVFRDIEVKEILLKKLDNPPYWELFSYIDSKGKYIRNK